MYVYICMYVCMVKFVVTRSPLNDFEVAPEDREVEILFLDGWHIQYTLRCIIC